MMCLRDLQVLRSEGTVEGGNAIAGERMQTIYDGPPAYAQPTASDDYFDYAKPPDYVPPQEGNQARRAVGHDC